LISTTEPDRSPVAADNRVMDKKVKKKQDVLRQRLQKLQQQLSGARKQMDDFDEVRRLEQELAATESELQKLK
jgi:DNA-binding FrmR family transcriptional regulator